jgi:hypothetical protein
MSHGTDSMNAAKAMSSARSITVAALTGRIP